MYQILYLNLSIIKNIKQIIMKKVTNARNASKTATPSKATLTAPAKIRKEDTSKVASKTGFSASHVSNVKAGRKYNESIINAFNGLTARRKK